MESFASSGGETSESGSQMLQNSISSEDLITDQSSVMRRVSEFNIDPHGGHAPDKFEAIPEDLLSEEESDDDEWDMPSTSQVQNVQTEKVMSRD